jgi:SAM-dependent methyltransferase
MGVTQTTTELLEEAAAAPVAGWDFRWIGGRLTTSPLPWDIRALAGDAMRAATTALDMGTGGGEFLSVLPGYAARTVATESWTPNVPIAARNLARLHIPVVHTAGSVDNALQADGRPAGALPFRDDCFDLVLNRHESFDATEVARVLRPGGRFLTQQAATGPDQFHALLGIAPPRRAAAVDLDLLVGQAVRAGLTVEEAATATERVQFGDIGAFAWYLRMVQWAVPGFSIDTHRSALETAASRDLVIYQERFLLRCRLG